MLKFEKFFAVTFGFLLLLTVGTMYLSVIRGEGLIRPEALVFYTIVFIGYAFTLRYVWGREVKVELEQAELEKKLALEEAQKHKEELEKIKKEFEEYKKKILQEAKKE